MEIIKPQIQLLVVYFSRITSLVVGLIATPLLLSNYGTERFAIYTLLISLISLMQIANFGIPAALKAYLAVYHSYNVRLSVYYRLFLSITVLSLFFLACALLFELEGVLIIFGSNIASENIIEAESATFIVIILFLMNLPVSLYQEGLIGLAKTHISALYEVSFNLSALLVVFLCCIYGFKLETLFLYRGTANILIGIIGLLHLHLSIKKSQVQEGDFESTDIENFDTSNVKLMRKCIFFAFTALASVIVWQTDNIIIANFVDLSAVTTYSLNFRLVSITFIFFTAISTIYNPYFGMLYGKNLRDKIYETHKIALRQSLTIAISFGIFLNLFGEDILQIWLGSQEFYSKGLILILTSYGLVMAHIHMTVALATAIGSIEKLALIGVIEGILNLILSLYLVTIFGVIGVALGTLLAATLTTAILVPKLSLYPFLKSIYLEYVSVYSEVFLKNSVLILVLALVMGLNLEIPILIKVAIILFMVLHNKRVFKSIVDFKKSLKT